MMKCYFSAAGLFSVLLACCACGEKQESAPVRFTKADSLMDTYLSLEDSLLNVWNMMINDDNRKIQAMQNLAHELRVSAAADPATLDAYEIRLKRLKNVRYTQQTMANPDVITEYDFASNSLITELISIAEMQKQFAYNTTLQKLVDQVRIADERALSYRNAYDEIASRYNEFVVNNHRFLEESETDSLEQKPLFQFASED
jgi:hypothetical protein